MTTFTKAGKLLKGLVLATGIAALACSPAHATVYTAIASGNYSSVSTWAGGNVPPSLLLADDVVIPAGINVVLDQAQTINGTLSTFNVDGTLTSSSSVNNALILSLGSLTGGGTLTLDSMVMQLSSGFSFTGSLMVKNFTSLGTTMSSAASLTVSRHLWLQDGIMNMTSGTLSLSSGAMIVVSGGILAMNGGMLNLNNEYHVMYTGSSSINAGLELTGSGLNKVIVNMTGGASVDLSSDLDVMDTLTLTSGVLDLNNHHLTFSGNGNFAASGTGSISAGTGSNIMINTANNFDGGIRFTSGSNVINNFVVNASNSGRTIRLGSDVMIGGQLNLQSGYLDAEGHIITVASGGTVLGGSSGSYVITGMNGGLQMNMTAGGSAMYHVGTASHYSPLMMTANSGSASGMVTVAADANVYIMGNSGGSVSATQPVVNNTWYVSHTSTASMDLDMELMWSANMEVNGFDHNDAYVAHYDNGNWDMNTVGAANTAPNGMYSMERNHATGEGPYAVMGKEANTTDVNEIVSARDHVIMYPNPVLNALNIRISASADFHTMDVFDVAGHIVKQVTLSGNTQSVDLSDLPSGYYTARFTGREQTATENFIKQ